MLTSKNSSPLKKKMEKIQAALFSTIYEDKKSVSKTIKRSISYVDTLRICLKRRDVFEVLLQKTYFQYTCLSQGKSALKVENVNIVTFVVCLCFDGSSCERAIYLPKSYKDNTHFSLILLAHFLVSHVVSEEQDGLLHNIVFAVSKTS